MLQQLATTFAVASVLMRMSFADEEVSGGSEPTKKCLINYLADSRKATFESCNCVSALDSCQSQVTSLESQLAGFSALSSELCQAEVSALEAQVANLQASAARTAAIVYREGAGSKAWSTTTPDEAYDDLLTFARETFENDNLDYFTCSFEAPESMQGVFPMRVENDADLASAFAITSAIGTVPTFQSLLAYRHLAEPHACCTSSAGNGFHRRCQGYNMSQSECMLLCDEDDNCKGFVMKVDGSTCQLATTSTCPASFDNRAYNEGNVGEIDLNATCGGGYKGCFVKRP